MTNILHIALSDKLLCVQEMSSKEEHEGITWRVLSEFHNLTNVYELTPYELGKAQRWNNESCTTQKEVMTMKLITVNIIGQAETVQQEKVL